MYNEKHPQAEGTDFETHSKFFWTPFWHTVFGPGRRLDSDL